MEGHATIGKNPPGCKKMWYVFEVITAGPLQNKYRFCPDPQLIQRKDTRGRRASIKRDSTMSKGLSQYTLIFKLAVTPYLTVGGKLLWLQLLVGNDKVRV